MKAGAGQTMPVEAAAVWAEDTPNRARGRKVSGLPWVTLAAVLILLAAAGVSGWLCLTGMRALDAAGAQIADGTQEEVRGAIAQLLIHAHVWGWQLMAAGIGGMLGLLTVAVAGAHWLNRAAFLRQQRQSQEAELRVGKILALLADAKVSREESHAALVQLQERLAEVVEDRASLQRELDERRLAEKSLTQQAQKLERSKDVLEMNVQMRTQELQKLQRRNELILTSAGEGICGFDLQGRATFVNPAAAKITGWRIEEMIGKTEAEIFFPAKTKGAKEALGVLKNERGEPFPEQLFHRKDATPFPVEYVRTAIKEDGRPMGTVVMFKDITERKLAEDRLAHKAAELGRSNAELEQFAYVASHDLQEPLRKIQAFGDRLKLKCEAVKLDEGRDYLERMQNASARMQTLINDLLTFSRIIRASQPFTRVDLQIVTKEVLGDLEHRIEKTKAQVEVGKLPLIDADPLQMRQLLQNLIGNALKFHAPDAAPVVKIDAQLVTRDQIRNDAVFPNPPPTASAEDKFCLLTVQDNGIGFEEQYLDKIFAVFQRLHGRGEYEGTGVGLAVCRRITDRHGGLITAQSKLGEGATFIVLLPVCQPKQEETE